MTQSADTRPEPNLQRKAAIAYAGATDFRGKVQIQSIPDFDLNRTIFQTLEGRAARYIMTKRVGKEVSWADSAAQKVQSDYDAATEGLTLPPIPQALMTFMVNECDFDVEHADGSFLDHLYFGYEYTAQHYPEGSPTVMLLHSILGTGTNTFAMTADKIPALRERLSPTDWLQVEAFPTVLRLLYSGEIRAELHDNPGRDIQAVRMRRVIDNEPIEMSGEAFWEAMNYQLIHLVDFLPVANWPAHLNDTSYILFRDVYDLMERAGKRVAKVGPAPADGAKKLVDEHTGWGGWLATKIPVTLSERLAAKSVRRFSEQCGHSLEYEIDWA